MADTVRVQFSASIGALIKGVEDAKSAIDSVRASTDRVTEGAKSLLEVFGVAFSVDRIKEFASQMAEAGEQIQRSAAMLGVSTTSIQQLGFIAKTTGGDAEGLALAMERLQVNLQKAASGTGPAAEALKALGLNAKTLAALPIDEQMNRIADAVSRFADGGNKTAIVMELMGRSGAQMIPVLDKGRDGLNELREASLSSASIMTSQTVTALAAFKERTTILNQSLTALGGTLVALSSGTLSSFADALTKTSADMTALASTGQLGKYYADVAGYAWQILGLRVKEAKDLVVDFFTAPSLSAMSGQMSQHLAETEAVIANVAKSEVAQLDGMINGAIDSYKRLLATTEQTTKSQAPSSSGPNKDAISAQMAQFQSQIKLADEAYRQTQEKLSSEVKLHQISYDEETQQLLAALSVRHAAEDAAADGEIALYAKGTAGYQKAINERRQLDAKYAADHQKIMDQALQHDTQQWQSVLGPIEGAFNSQLRSLLAGTETWGQAMKKIFADLVIVVIEGFEKIAFQWVATQLAMAVGGPSTAAVAALKDITSSAAAVGAEVTAQLTPAIGYPAALSAGAAAEAGVVGSFATQAGAASLETGAWEVPGGLANLHPGEMVVPQTFAAALRSNVSGDGGGVTHNWNISGPVIGTQAWINSMIPQLQRALNGYGALNPSQA